MNAREAVEFAKKNEIVMVDFKFTDLPGMWQHFSIPISEFGEDLFEDGLGFDGSSIRGWKTIESSDMLVVPDPTTAILDPFTQHKTLSLICDIVDPITRERYSRDPRHVASKAVNYLRQTAIGDTIHFGPEAEFFIFNSARFETGPAASFYYVDSREGRWNSGLDESEGNLAYKPRYKEGYFPVPPTDSFQDLRSEMVIELERAGIVIEAQHHEVGTGGQAEIDMKFGPLVDTADKLMLYKYIVKNVARRHNFSVTFMAKPIFGDNGSGMHCHQSIWKGNQPLFAGDKYAGLSDIGLWYIGGILKHAKALAVFTNPTTNSYRRLVPGYEAPINLAYSSRNRSAACRIPMYSPSPKAKRVEVRFPDPTCNPYLAFAAMAMAGIDGIENKIDPGEPLDKNLYALSPEEAANVPQMPSSLNEALEHLEADSDFLLKGDVFTPDLVETWIQYKRENEVEPVQLRPHPHEFELYFDA
ncbi:MAG: type I glutamate--ammonia ligase [Deltaproteobacteria bacterium]|nr:MAG: type I glutamate--ammonia ligase [Deltaproteobacteria bacterium]